MKLSERVNEWVMRTCPEGRHVKVPAGEDLDAILEDIDALQGEPEECREQRCNYYRFYLSLGAADLEHHGYHYAEERCREAQKRYEQHLDTCKRQSCYDERVLNRQATIWEERIVRHCAPQGEPPLVALTKGRFYDMAEV